MPFSLYDAIVPNYLQILSAVAGLLDKAEAFCAEQDMASEDLVGARLADDMLPFGYQVKSCAAHSIGAIDGVRNGEYSPDRSPPPTDMETLKSAIADARAAIEAIDPAEVNGFIGQDMRFAFNDFRMDFTAENFLLSFAQPNFYFHATTVYDIMRWKGVPLGKRDYMGMPRIKT